MGMVDGLIEGLGKTPAVQDAIVKFEELRDGVIAAMKHFNTRFDKLEEKTDTMSAKADRILFVLEHPSDISPAADDGLLKLLAEEGQEMIMQQVEPMPVVNVPETQSQSV